MYPFSNQLGSHLNRNPSVTPVNSQSSSLGRAKAAKALMSRKSAFGIETFDDSKEYSQAAFVNGIWEQRTTFVGRFVHQKTDISIPSLEKYCQPSFALLMDKIPYSAYEAILEFFKLVSAKWKDEVIVQIFWDKVNSEYVLDIPNQIVSGASIDFKRDEGKMIDPNYIWVMDFHSHNEMGAFWSGQDTRDEISTRIFGVLGRVSSSPEYKLRAGCNGQFVELTLDQVFDRESPVRYHIDLSNLEKIKRCQPVVHPFYTPGVPGAQNLSGANKQFSTYQYPAYKYPNRNLNPLNSASPPKKEFVSRKWKDAESFYLDDSFIFDDEYMSRGSSVDEAEELYLLQTIREVQALSDSKDSRFIHDILDDAVAFLEAQISDIDSGSAVDSELTLCEEFYHFMSQ